MQVPKKTGHNNNSASVPFRSIAQFYDSDDPSPEADRQLCDRAEKHIMRAVLDLPKGYPGFALERLELVFPATDLTPGRVEAVISAAREHFRARAPDYERDRRLTMRVGRRESLLTIIICIPAFAGIAICSPFHGNPIAEVVGNVLIILTWVVIWQPFQSIVFDRWTQNVMARLCRHVAVMDISVWAA